MQELPTHQVREFTNFQTWNFRKNAMLAESRDPDDHNAIKIVHPRWVLEVVYLNQAGRKKKSDREKNIGKIRRANFDANDNKQTSRDSYSRNI